MKNNDYHHFIPQVYLKKWATRGTKENLRVFYNMNDIDPIGVNSKKILGRDNFNTINGSRAIETELGNKYDNKYNHLLEEIEKNIFNKKSRLQTEKLKNEITEYITIQFLRNPYSLETLYNYGPIKDLLYELNYNQFKNIREEIEKNLNNNILNIIFNSEDLRKHYTTIYNIFNSMEYLFYDNKTNINFITNDRGIFPNIKIKNNYSGGFYFPLTPFKLLRLCKCKTQHKYQVIDCYDQEMIKYINYIIFENRKELVINNNNKIRHLISNNYNDDKWKEIINFQIKY